MLHNFMEIAVCHFQQSTCTYFSVECSMSYDYDRRGAEYNNVMNTTDDAV